MLKKLVDKLHFNLILESLFHEKPKTCGLEKFSVNDWIRISRSLTNLKEKLRLACKNEL